MFGTLQTLFRGVAAEAEEAVIDRHAVRLLDQKIRDAEGGLKAAKLSLTGLVKKDRLEERQIDEITNQIGELEIGVRAALDAGDQTLAETGAAAIAELENERDRRETTRTELKSRTARLHHSLATAVRRMADLRHAAAVARAVDQERRGQRPLRGAAPSDMTQAEALVTRILGQEDPFEDDQILAEIDAGLTGKGAAAKLAEAGYGPKAKSTGASVLARMTSKS